jgi:hypothetical protein
MVALVLPRLRAMRLVSLTFILLASSFQQIVIANLNLLNRQLSISSKHEGTGYLRSRPSQTDFHLLDIKHETLLTIGKLLGIQYLGRDDRLPTYPVTGKIYGQSSILLMVNLLCTRQNLGGKQGPQINVVFLIHTGSPVSFLSQQAMQALIEEPEAQVPGILDVNIHDGCVVRCHLSPKDKDFQDVNVLGMDYISSRRACILLKDDETVELCSSHRDCQKKAFI